MFWKLINLERKSNFILDFSLLFRYSPIKSKEIKVPPLIIKHIFAIETIQLYRLKDEVKRQTNK